MEYLLNGEDLEGISQFLRSRQWIGPDEKLLSARKPGEGNMNYTLRIRTDFRTFILKQSRDYVEKYPSIPAPSHRAIVEGSFYEVIQLHPDLRAFTPEVMFMDAENSLLMLEDLGDSMDYSRVYQPGKELSKEEIETLVSFLNLLHHQIKPEDTSFDFSNRDMRNLNGEHIFRYPFMEENGFDLDTVTPGLQEVAMSYKTDLALKKVISSLEQVYQSDGVHLLHGDYYPGSWLNTLNGIRIIDPEFGFFGPAEFDVSVMMAHMHLADLSEETHSWIMDAYDEPTGFSTHLTQQLVGIEIMRRLIGLAQLPVHLSLEQKQSLLASAREMIMS